jgi:alpha-mannosidase
MRMQRSVDLVALDIEMELSFAPDGRLDVDVRIESAATDHLVRLRLPLGSGTVRYATQFGDDTWPTPRNTERWIHPAPTTFCQQGWIAGGGLLVLAPGLPEAAFEQGDLDLTVVRAVGWMSRPDLRTRPGRASPAIPVPAAQLGRIEARISLLPDPGTPAERWRESTSGSRPVIVTAAGAVPLVAAGVDVVHVEGAVPTACKPADDGDGVVLRVWNPTDEPADVTLRSALPVWLRRCRLDESEIHDDAGFGVSAIGDGRCVVAPHEPATFRVRPLAAG